MYLVIFQWFNLIDLINVKFPLDDMNYSDM